jgi:dTDP-4-dehydrorhamnose reductase
MKVFVAGSKGMLATDLLWLLEKDHEVFKGSRPRFDITDINSVKEAIVGVRPDWVINCAAYTAVDRAETEPELAFKVNGMGPGNLASVCRDAGAGLVHISTDFVFDGKKNTPYRESDATSPVNTYGKSKLEGELKVREILPGSVIIRTSWLYGLNGANFVKTIIRLALERESLDVVLAQVGCPTSTGDLASGIVNLIEAGVQGIFHFSNEGVASRYDLAYEIVDILKQKGVPLKAKTLRPIVTESQPGLAIRPNYTVLDKSKYKKAAGKEIAHWREALKRFLDSYSLETLKEDMKRC